MREAKFSAYIKKVEIVNKVATSETKDDEQVLRITLDEVAINDESLLLLRKFPPGSSVAAIITPYQLQLQDAKQNKDGDLFKTEYRSVCRDAHYEYGECMVCGECDNCEIYEDPAETDDSWIASVSKVDNKTVIHSLSRSNDSKPHLKLA